MKKIMILLGAFSLLTCTQDNLKTVLNDSEKGSVKLSVNLGNFFIGGSGADSPWNHVYQESLEITFSSTTTDYTSTVSFNPNDLSTFPETSLPYDTYSWSITKTGDDVAVSDVLYIYGSSSSDFTVDSPTTTVPLVLETDFALVTISTENLNSAGIRYNGESTDLIIQDGYYFGYINTNNTPYTFQIVSSDDLAGVDTISDPVAYTHYNYQVTFDRSSSIGVSLSLSQNFVLEDRNITAEDDDDLDGVPDFLDQCPDTPVGTNVNEYGCDITNAVYLDENGVTVKAFDWAQPGDIGEVNGIIYIVIDNDTFRNSVEVPSNWCTSLVTDMSRRFYGYSANIGSFVSTWDVSKVTSMEWMFGITGFNEDISMWDVSNVTNMSGMFAQCAFFNQDISGWDTSSVTNMEEMFWMASRFNQDLGSWDVSNVINMTGMFMDTNSFNQDLSSWNVTKVNSCSLFNYNNSYWILPQPNFTNCSL